jgi:hypothetical protein
VKLRISAEIEESLVVGWLFHFVERAEEGFEFVEFVVVVHLFKLGTIGKDEVQAAIVLEHSSLNIRNNGLVQCVRSSRSSASIVT